MDVQQNKNGKEKASVEDQVYELERKVRFWQQETARVTRLYAMLQEEMIQSEDRYDRLAKELAELKKR